jgi:DNA-binding NtrC family response regulator
LRALDNNGWNRKAAARSLGVSYKTLLNKLRKWQISGRGGEPETAASDAHERPTTRLF